MKAKVPPETKFETLYDHYKDTFAHTRGYIKQRDWFFLLILILLSIMLFQMVAPTVSSSALSDFVVKYFDLNTPIDISFINSVIWFSLLALVVRYYQRVIHIERQYKYLHQLEEEINSYYEDKLFTRESISYLSSYRLFSNWAWRLYSVFFPLLLILVLFIKLLSELFSQNSPSIIIAFDTIAFLGISIFSGLYLFSIHFGKRQKA